MRSKLKKLASNGLLYILIGLICLFWIAFPLGRIYFPGLVDWSLNYSRLSNISTEEPGYENKVIESINLEIVNPYFYRFSTRTPSLKDKIDNISDWHENTINSDDFDDEAPNEILHLRFTDKTTFDIPIERSQLPTIFNEWIVNDELASKIKDRFSENVHSMAKSVAMRYILGRLYIGDTIFKPSTSLTSFDLKQPNTGKSQTYYIYGESFSENSYPVFLTQEKSSADKPLKNGETYQFKQGSEDPERQIFDSVSFDDLPLGITDTGYQFKVDVTVRQTESLEDGDKLLVKTKTFTYDESNKDQYISDILDYLE